MASPKPWSFTALDTFKTCPRQYHAKYVTKSVTEAETEQMRWGKWVHSAFEDRQAVNKPLPKDLTDHEEYMVRLEAKPGVLFTEQKVGLTKKLQPCSFFDRDIFCRAIVDWQKVDRVSRTATIVDYKTGKKNPKFAQIALSAIHCFTLYPDVDIINAQFYWTIDKDVSKQAWGRADIPALWQMFLPDLRQYREAYEHDIWQPRQSGLCAGWCPVKDCEFWSPKREKTER